MISLQNLSLRTVVVSPFLLIANVVSDERTYDFEHWDLDKDGVLTGYEVMQIRLRYISLVL